ncbi:MAG TPA: hypothetical protein DD435_15920 [Cyanobacteria bacterium UBA8530]|nr:hypothetical protein [Cyanobacteria bacterium UBA8530]
MRKWTSRTYASAGWACLLWIGWGFVGIQYYWPVRYWGLERASHRADPLISALERFTKEQGRPPAKLSELLPRYIREIPTTGLPAYPTFKYERLPGRQSLAFWDLGSRNGLPMRGLWVYPDGKPEHAIMALTLSERGEVLDARMDRMPEQVLDVAFDQAKWKSGVERMRMVRLFAKTHSLKGRTLGELKKILGEPAGTRCLVDASWEIRIDCPMGILNWDTFYYWPTQRYPKQSHGGGVVRVGKWAYVHE